MKMENKIIMKPEWLYILGWLDPYFNNTNTSACIQVLNNNAAFIVTCISQIDKDYTRSIEGYKTKVEFVFDQHSTTLIQLLNSKEITMEDKWHCMRGYFDGHGKVTDPKDMKPFPTCSLGIYTYASKLIANYSEIPWITDTDTKGMLPIVLFKDTNCIDFLGKLYGCGLKLPSNYDLYIEWLTWKPTIDLVTTLPECLVFRTNKLAVPPTKAKESDVGYDLSIISVEKTMLSNVTLYDTGLKIHVQHGMYAEVVPRSSLSKSGYMLANSIGIIDRGYNGNILIALTKIDPDAPNLVLPFRCCQLIFRQQIHVNMIEVAAPFEKTVRGDGGFGSTGI
jgi:deoxyuridine 5'-triphosphate nucleotidohydrolase